MIFNYGARTNRMKGFFNYLPKINLYKDGLGVEVGDCEWSVRASNFHPLNPVYNTLYLLGLRKPPIKVDKTRSDQKVHTSLSRVSLGNSKFSLMAIAAMLNIVSAMQRYCFSAEGGDFVLDLENNHLLFGLDKKLKMVLVVLRILNQKKNVIWVGLS